MADFRIKNTENSNILVEINKITDDIIDDGDSHFDDGHSHIDDGLSQAKTQLINLLRKNKSKAGIVSKIALELES